MPVQEEAAAEEEEEPKRAGTRPKSESPQEVVGSSAQKKRLSSTWKDASRLMRMVVFGHVGNDETNYAEDAREAETLCQETVGSHHMVAILFGFWSELCDFRSGHVDLAVLRLFAARRLRALTQVQRSAFQTRRTSLDEHALAEELCLKADRLLLRKRGASCFVVEDIMRLLWPAATFGDLKIMKQWCAGFAAERKRSKVQAPPLLHLADFDDLRSVFQQVDVDGSGTVDVRELREAGIICDNEGEGLLKDLQGSDGDGDCKLDLLKFCELMCPFGYRAHAEAKVGTTEDGVRVFFDPKLKMWRMDPTHEQQELANEGWFLDR